VALAIIMLVNSVVSIYYYFAVPRQMLFQEADDGSPLRVPALVTAVVAVAMVALIAIFILPNPFARVAELSSLLGIT
jgi:NADH:ubiquinone oxidoreductase subunit 2 (subunit N)